MFLHVGRMAVEKNVETFLAMDLPGSKLVVGGGPQLEDFKARYPEVTFTGARSGRNWPHSMRWAMSSCFRR